jgi:hypothetical protein
LAEPPGGGPTRDDDLDFAPWHAPQEEACGAALTLEPAADEFADLVYRFSRKAVALDLEALQVLGQPHLKAQDFQQQVRLVQ